MSLDIIPARSEAEWPSSPEGGHVRRTWYNVARHYTGPERSGVAILPGGGHVQRTWYNVARHYTGPERSGEAILPGGAMSKGHGIMSLDIIPARSEAEWPSSPEGAMSKGHGIMSYAL